MTMKTRPWETNRDQSTVAMVARPTQKEHENVTELKVAAIACKSLVTHHKVLWSGLDASTLAMQLYTTVIEPLRTTTRST